MWPLDVLTRSPGNFVLLTRRVRMFSLLKRGGWCIHASGIPYDPADAPACLSRDLALPSLGVRRASRLFLLARDAGSWGSLSRGKSL